MIQPSKPDPAAPWGAPPDRPRRRVRPSLYWLLAPLMLATPLIGAYRDLSRPEAWAYWRDLYVAPSLTAETLPAGYRDAGGRDHVVLAVRGTIGAAAGPWLRTALDAAHLATGDAVALASPGGNLDQAMIMGDVIRARGLVTIVGRARGTSDGLGPAYCASACVFVFAGGTTRVAEPGSQLGVHRFTTSGNGADPVADTQRTSGRVIGYMMRMGVSPTIVEAMSSTQDIKWLDPKDAAAMTLVTATGDAGDAKP